MKYLDASAWVKAYVAEPGSQAVARMLAEGDCVASELAAVETVAAIARRARPSASRSRTLKQVAEDQERILLIPLDAAVGELARTVSVAHGLRGADAVHLATAILAKAVEPSIELVASDTELLRAAEAIGFATLDPAQG